MKEGNKSKDKLKTLKDKLRETDRKDTEAFLENNAERQKLDEEKNSLDKNVRKFLWWIVGNGTLQLLVGIISSLFTLNLSSMIIIGLLIFQLLFLFVLAECYELNFMKILIDLMIKSKRNL